MHRIDLLAWGGRQSICSLSGDTQTKQKSSSFSPAKWGTVRRPCEAEESLVCVGD